MMFAKHFEWKVSENNQTIQKIFSVWNLYKTILIN